MAENLYALCAAREDLSRYYLSTNLCPAHRLERLEAIHNDLNAGKPVLCISTQLIECGVDISFRSVIRLAAGLDSILQAAGRCNRHGEGASGRVHVVRVDGDVENLDWLRDIKDGRDIFLNVIRVKFAKELQASDYDLTLPLLTEAYFDHYFHRRADVLSYAVERGNNTLLDMLGSNQHFTAKSLAPMLGQSFGTAAQKFKAIDSAATSILVPYGEGERIIADLCSTDILYEKKVLLRKAQRYSRECFSEYQSRAGQGQGAVSHSGQWYVCIAKKFLLH